MKKRFTSSVPESVLVVLKVSLCNREKTLFRATSKWIRVTHCTSETGVWIFKMSQFQVILTLPPSSPKFKRHYSTPPLPQQLTAEGKIEICPEKSFEPRLPL